MVASISSSAAMRWIVPVAALALSGLAAGATNAPAAPAATDQVTVSFDHPEKFTDLQDRRLVDERVTNTYVADLRRFIETHAAEHLAAGQRLVVTITDVDMAGELETRGNLRQDVRLLRPATPPRINLSFQVVDAGGNVLKSGDRRLTDLDYQHPEYRSHDTTLFFEKKLLSDWLNDEFRP